MIDIIMRRKLFFLLGLVGFVILIIGLVKLVGSRSSRQGVLKVNSTPAASIFLDNKHKGRTPFEDKVDAGEYTIKIVPDATTTSLASWQGKIIVAQNLLTYVNRDLAESELSSAGDVLWLEKITSNKSEISVITIPDGATLLLDDENKGVTPVALSTVAPADHTISVTSPGFLPRTLKVKTTAGYKLNVLMQLALSSGTANTPVASPSPSVAPSGSPTPKPTSGTSADPTKPFVIIKDTPIGFLRVRFAPSTDASVSGQVNPGEKYTILDSQSGWYQIKYDGTNKGWVSGQYTEKVE